jgi:hypothetical protein
LNAELEEVSIYAVDPQEATDLTLGIEDVAATTKAENVDIHEGEGGELEVEGYAGIRFSMSNSGALSPPSP